MDESEDVVPPEERLYAFAITKGLNLKLANWLKNTYVNLDKHFTNQAKLYGTYWPDDELEKEKYMLKILEHAQRITPLHEELFEDLSDIILQPKAQA